MSSYLSTPLYRAPIAQDVNAPLREKILLMKQQKYDENFAKMQQTLDAWGSLDLARDQDKEYLSGKLEEVTNNINNIGGKDLSQNYIATDLTNKIKSIASDKNIINAVEQTGKIRNFEKSVLAAKESKDGLYNEGNHKFALEFGGYNDYMRGYDKNGNKVDKLGNLSYVNYQNANKKLDEAIQKWAKDYAVETKFEGGDSSKPIYYDEKHEVISRDRIIQKLRSELSPDLQKQLYMDAWNQFEGVNDDKLHDSIKLHYDRELSNIDVNIAEEQAKASVANPKDKAIHLSNIAEYKKNKSDALKRVTERTYNVNDEKFTLYTSSVFNSIADSYAKDEVVDRVRNVDNFEIIKFNTQTEQKNKELALREKANKIASESNVIASALKMDAKDQPEVEQRSKTQIGTDINLQNYKTLKSKLLSEDKIFPTLKTKEEQDAYILNLISNKSTNIRNLKSESLVKAIEDFKATSQIKYQADLEIKKDLDSTFENVYNSLNSKKTNLEGLAKTLPTTVKFIRQGKALESLLPQDQALVKYEMAVNHMNYRTAFSEEYDNDNLNTLKTYTKQLENTKGLTQEQKAWMKAKSKEDNSMFDAVVDFASSSAKYAKNLYFDPITTVVKWALSNSGDKEKEDDRNTGLRDLATNFTKSAQSLRKINNISRDYIGESDSNLAEIEGGDRTSGGDVERDIFQTVKNASSKRAEILNKIVPTEIDYKQLSFDPSSKYGKTLHTAIAASAGGKLEVEKGSIFTVLGGADSNSVRVQYIPKDGELTTVTLPTSTFPDLAGAMQTNIVPRHRNKNNNDAPMRLMTIDTPENISDRHDIIYQLHQAFPNEISQQAVTSVNSNAIYIPTKIDMLALSKNQPADIQQKIQQIADTELQVKWKAMSGSWIGTVVFPNGRDFTVDGKETTVSLSDNYSEGEAAAKALEVANKAKYNFIKELIKK